MQFVVVTTGDINSSFEILVLPMQLLAMTDCATKDEFKKGVVHVHYQTETSFFTDYCVVCGKLVFRHPVKKKTIVFNVHDQKVRMQDKTVLTIHHLLNAHLVDQATRELEVNEFLRTLQSASLQRVVERNGKTFCAFPSSQYPMSKSVRDYFKQTNNCEFNINVIYGGITYRSFLIHNSFFNSLG